MIVLPNQQASVPPVAFAAHCPDRTGISPPHGVVTGTCSGRYCIRSMRSSGTHSAFPGGSPMTAPLEYQFHHIHVFCSDLDATQRWFTDGVGAELVGRADSRGVP